MIPTRRYPKLYGNADVGRRLREFRKGRGLTQGQMAQLLATSPKVVSFWENGIRKLPSEKAISLVQHFPSVSLDWVLLGKGNPPADAAGDRLDALEQSVSQMRADIEMMKNFMMRDGDGARERSKPQGKGHVADLEEYRRPHGFQKVSDGR